MAKTQAMVLSLGFQFPVSAGFHGKVALVLGKVALVFGFSFGLRDGVVVFLPRVNIERRVEGNILGKWSEQVECSRACAKGTPMA